MDTSDVTAALLAEREWLQRVALALVRDASEADDLVQETYVEALERSPQGVRETRGWLATVLRRRLGRRRLENARRVERETRASRPEVQDALETEARIARAGALVRHVHALSEPFRTALVLRYFEDLPPRTIAARHGVPVATVQSRLHRGLEQLRARLDAEHGGRREWLAAVAALAAPRDGAAIVPGVAIGALSLVSFKTWISVAAALMVATVFLMRFGDDSLRSMGEPRGLVVERESGVGALFNGAGAPSRATVAEVSERAPREARVGIRASADATVEVTAAALSARVVDVRGRPLPGVPILHHGAVWPRWQSGDVGWINDGQTGCFLPPDRVAALRGDATRAAELLRGARHPEDWRHVVLGEPLPERTTISDAVGEVRFADLPEDAILDVADARWLLLGEARDANGLGLLVVAPAVAVGGTVLDAKLQPAPRARVSLEWTPALALAPALVAAPLRRPWSTEVMNADDDGRYFLRVVPVGLIGCTIAATRSGQESQRVSPPSASREDFDLVLTGAARGAIAVEGRVLGPDGAPVPGAAVFVGDERSAANAEGRFRFEGVVATPGLVLTAFGKGFTPARVTDLAARLDAVSAGPLTLELRLAERARTLRGRVLDAEGRPLRGVCVNLFDPLLLDLTFTPVEGHIGGWEHCVETDAAGRFELPGLTSRTYRLRVYEPDSAFVYVTSEPPDEGGEVTIRVPRGAFFGEVRGVVTSEGPLPEGLQVAVSYTVHVTQRGDGSMTEGGEPTPVAADGTFVLRDVPRRFASVLVGASTENVTVVPVEAISPVGELSVRLASARTLHIMGSATGATARVLDGNGAPLDVLVASAARATPFLEAMGEDFPPCTIPRSARAVAVVLADGRWLELPIVDDAYNVSRARLPRE